MIDLIHGDCLEKLKALEENSVDAVVTDPPYGLGKEPDPVEIMKSWIEKEYHEVKGSGFMSNEWDAFVPQPNLWKEVFRVLKPGGHLLAFFGTRTYDWGAMALRFAGFEIRDTLAWIYGQGYAKGRNIGLAVAELRGEEIKKGELKFKGGTQLGIMNDDNWKAKDVYEQRVGNEWKGWGTCLKPAMEPIVLCRKPISEKTISENVLKWGTGGLNIDTSRIAYKNETPNIGGRANHGRGKGYGFKPLQENIQPNTQGRFPANFMWSHHPDCKFIGTQKVGSGKEGGYDYLGKEYQVERFVKNCKPQANSNCGKEEVEVWECVEDCPSKLFPHQKSGTRKSEYDIGNEKGEKFNHGIYGKYKSKNYEGVPASEGSASRFFFCAKASKQERNEGLENNESGNTHCTVKPLSLCSYLVKLICPPKGIVLDPFMGSGSTGIACKINGFNFIGIELNKEYFEIAKARIENWENGQQLLF